MLAIHLILHIHLDIFQDMTGKVVVGVVGAERLLSASQRCLHCQSQFLCLT